MSTKDFLHRHNGPRNKDISLMLHTMGLASIDQLIEETFHAKLIITDKEGQTQSIDARPSDGVALAVRAQAPIFVEDIVFEQASALK